MRYFTRPPFHWLLYLVISYIAGIGFQVLVAQSLLLPLLPTVLLLCVLRITNAQMRKYLFSLTACLMFAGGGILYEMQQTQHRYLQNLLIGKGYDLTATISDIDALSTGYLRTKLTLTIDALNPSLASIAQGKTIMLYTKKVPELCVGDVVHIPKQYFKEISNDSYNGYLIKEGIITTAFVNDLSYTLIARPSWCISRWIHTQKHRVLDALRTKMSKKNFTVAALTFYGSHDTSHYYMQHIKEGCRRWGVSHLLARSGLHLVIFVMLWQWILQILPVRYRLKQLLMLVLGISYYLFSWPGVAFNRAFLTFLAHKTGNLFYLQTDLMHLLTIVCFIVLLCNPTQLLFLDFQLTFGLTAGLAIINRAPTPRVMFH